MNHNWWNYAAVKVLCLVACTCLTWFRHSKKRWKRRQCIGDSNNFHHLSPPTMFDFETVPPSLKTAIFHSTGHTTVFLKDDGHKKRRNFSGVFPPASTTSSFVASTSSLCMPLFRNRPTRAASGVAVFNNGEIIISNFKIFTASAFVWFSFGWSIFFFCWLGFHFLFAGISSSINCSMNGGKFSQDERKKAESCSFSHS